MGKKRVQNLVDHSEHVDKVSMSELSDANIITKKIINKT
jgi:hypothetical protein